MWLRIWQKSLALLLPSDWHGLQVRLAMDTPPHRVCHYIVRAFDSLERMSLVPRLVAGFLPSWRKLRGRGFLKPSLERAFGYSTFS